MNLTLDNHFRCPWRWGRYPIDLFEEIRVYGIKFIRLNEPARFETRWILSLYFHRWVWHVSNYPL